MTRWFELDDAGLVRRARSRPLGRLALEAVQNALDAGASHVAVELDDGRLVIDDDAGGGIGDGRLVYTVFASDKPQDPTRRGRLGRGLKELLAAGDRARVETVAATFEFDASGRRELPSERTLGTRIVVERAFDEPSRRDALELARSVIPPRGVSLRVQGRSIRRPRSVLGLPSVELESVVLEEGIERAVLRPTTLDVYTPRRGEPPSLFELGIPVMQWNVPWHVDVGQRIPLDESRSLAPERFVLAVKAALLEAMLHRYLDRRDLRADWVGDVLARWPLTTGLLDAYVSKVFPKGSVLGAAFADATSLARDDRARQLGAHVVEAASLSHGAYLALGRVLETSAAFVERRGHELAGDDVEPGPSEAAFADAVRTLCAALGLEPPRLRFHRARTDHAGLREVARTDVAARIVSFDVGSALRLDDLLDPYTLGIVLHELAHLTTAEHDHVFIARLQQLAGLVARRLADDATLATRLRAPTRALARRD